MGFHRWWRLSWQISIDRAEYGIPTAKYPHYAQHGVPLILLSVVDGVLVLAERYKLKGLVIAGLWLACLATLVGNWDFRIYPKLYAEKLEGRECLKSYYENGFEKPALKPVALLFSHGWLRRFTYSRVPKR